MYPVNLNVAGRLCLVVGGGRVALRKIRNLVEHGARVRVVAPEVVPEVQALAGGGQIELLLRGFQQGDASGAFLVFAATDQVEVQAVAAADARKYGALLNSADSPELCDFQLPAYFCRGGFQLAISTDGGSPAFSRFIRQKLEDEFGDEYEYSLCLLAIIRKKALAAGLDVGHNQKMFRKLLDDDLVDCIKSESWANLSKILYCHLPKQIDAEEIMEDFRGKCCQN
ncbi:precorrin-2 dehydrogenase/sirohydrochlorin ferrochelatase family protein [Desulfotalea psychrophila]|uniref:precorrin-2 dehydrogenase n=1 Tax=Desulfotalea psychrophila (strain LSv54 / DSM 12343) TaxID=177439 RepID=Q6AIM0_DESPS|nr:bifunctional precorrin-2 dehydrogenase/sirohydrochlorin ferrochelatase [Desulfotalea psychrophila]CAG37810.1 related to siroheme synthase [Desulfotalea psychrophila LSv54]